MNYADSEKINMTLFQSWFNKIGNINEADLVIFNTCSVRKKWEDKVFWIINDLRKNSKKTWKKVVIWISGCMVRKTWLNKNLYDFKWDREAAKWIELLENQNSLFNSDDKIFWRTDKIDFVFRIEEIGYLSKLLSVIFGKEIWNDEKFNEYLQIKQYQENKWSANVIIQTWCDNFCTYCIVPHTRWREKSRDKNQIISEIKEVVANGTKEIFLIWQNVNSYWKDIKTKLWNPEELRWKSDIITNYELRISNEKESFKWFKTPFRELLEDVDKIEWLDRIRFTSSNPHDMTRDILDAHFELGKTCNYLHFALQSWDDEVLKNMNRKHSYDDFKLQVKYLRSLDPLFSISTDIIVWFSGETEDQFQNTIKAFEELEFDFAYIARYSQRAGTIAANNLPDNVSSQEKARRWHILNSMLEVNVKKRWEMMIGRIEPVLISWITKSGKFFWRTRNFKEVHFPKTESLNIWDLVQVKIEKMNKWILEGSLI